MRARTRAHTHTHKLTHAHTHKAHTHTQVNTRTHTHLHTECRSYAASPCWTLWRRTAHDAPTSDDGSTAARLWPSASDDDGPNTHGRWPAPAHATPWLPGQAARSRASATRLCIWPARSTTNASNAATFCSSCSTPSGTFPQVMQENTLQGKEVRLAWLP